MATTNTLTNSGLYINTIYSLSDPSSVWIDFTNPGNVGINGNLSVSNAIITSSITGTYSVGNLNNQSSLCISGGNNTTPSANPVVYLTDAYNVSSLMCICNSGAGNYNPIVQTGDNTIISNGNSLQQNANLDICVFNSTANGVQINSNSTTLWGDTTSLLVSPSGIVANGSLSVNGSIDASGGTVTSYNMSCNNTIESQYANISSANINAIYCPSISNVNTMYCATNGAPALLNIYAGNSADAGSNPAIRISNIVLPGQYQPETNWIQHVCNSSVAAWNSMVNTGDNSIISNSNLAISVWSDISGNTYNNGLQITNNSTTLWGDTTYLLVNPSGIVADGNLDVTGNTEISGTLSVGDGITTSSINGTSSIDGNTDNSCLYISGGNSATSSAHPVLYLTDLSEMGSLMCICNSGAGNYNPIVQTGDNTIISNWNSQQPNVNLDICVWNSTDTANGVQITNNSTTLWGDTTSLSVNPNGVLLNGSLSVSDNAYTPTPFNLYSQYLFTTDLSSNVPTSIALSSTGQYQTVVIDSTTIYTSSNFGQTWSTQTVTKPCKSVSMSNSGQYQIISTNIDTTTANNNIYYSVDYGSTFTSYTTQNNAVCVAVSPDGLFFTYTSLNGTALTLNTYLSSTSQPFARTTQIISNPIGVNGYLLYCTNSITNNAAIINISCTFDGPSAPYTTVSNGITMTTYPYPYQYFFNSYVSTNNNGNYIINPVYQPPNMPPLKSVINSVMSNDGQYWMIGDIDNECVWISNNSGNTFQQMVPSSLPFIGNGCIMDSSGNCQIVATGNGMYTSNNYGESFELRYIYSNSLYSNNISGNGQYYGIVTNAETNIYLLYYNPGTVAANTFSTNYTSLPSLTPYNIGYTNILTSPVLSSPFTITSGGWTNAVEVTIKVPGIYMLTGGFIGTNNAGILVLMSITTDPLTSFNSNNYSNIAFQTCFLCTNSTSEIGNVTGGNLSTIVSMSPQPPTGVLYSCPCTFRLNFCSGTTTNAPINNFQAYLQYVKIA